MNNLPLVFQLPFLLPLLRLLLPLGLRFPAPVDLTQLLNLFAAGDPAGLIRTTSLPAFGATPATTLNSSAAPAVIGLSPALLANNPRLFAATPTPGAPLNSASQTPSRFAAVTFTAAGALPLRADLLHRLSQPHPWDPAVAIRLLGLPADTPRSLLHIRLLDSYAVMRRYETYCACPVCRAVNPTPPPSASTYARLDRFFETLYSHARATRFLRGGSACADAAGRRAARTLAASELTSLSATLIPLAAFSRTGRLHATSSSADDCAHDSTLSVDPCSGPIAAFAHDLDAILAAAPLRPRPPPSSHPYELFSSSPRDRSGSRTHTHTHPPISPPALRSTYPASVTPQPPRDFFPDPPPATPTNSKAESPPAVRYAARGLRRSGPCSTTPSHQLSGAISSDEHIDPCPARPGGPPR